MGRSPEKLEVFKRDKRWSPESPLGRLRGLMVAPRCLPAEICIDQDQQQDMPDDKASLICDNTLTLVREQAPSPASLCQMCFFSK